MRTRVKELLEQVREQRERPLCTHSSCENERITARRMGESMLMVLRMATELDSEELVEPLHGFILCLEAFREYNDALGGDERVTLEDVQTTIQAALVLVGEELVELQDMNII